ncbi:hypothetical protein RHS01_06721 [Rhizoctonia solani]|uniref:Uncharacterized protein n=1 Tax=Rhizoctonia solani TaxID=456999 RepID=A0A8H7ICG4_9AGAM|nr:hypothetical protein RHS01_06721 [Rhizoctonia solani]
MSRISTSAHTTAVFTFDGTNLLYGNIPRVEAKQLRYLLVRGSGHVIRGNYMPKAWFRAQCAHYGLPTSDTLAALRNQLELFVNSPLPEVPRGLVILEEQKRDEYSASSRALGLGLDLLQKNFSTNQLQNEFEQNEEPISPGFSGETREAQHTISTKIAQPLADDTNLCSTPITKSPKKLSLPRAKIFAVAKFKKSVRWDPVLAENALQEIKLRMGLAPLIADVVSGRWELCVTDHTISPLPAPWRTASPKWLKGDMDVRLTADGRSLTGNFALLGLNGKFKSEKCRLYDGGIGIWIRFVARMPITTTKPIRHQGHEEHNLAFGPSETQYGYLRFRGGNKVWGMLRCRKYGKLDFDGVRTQEPVNMGILLILARSQ